MGRAEHAVLYRERQLGELHLDSERKRAGRGFQSPPRVSTKYTREFTHFDMWSYGTSLLDLNDTKSDAKNPVFDQMGPGLAVVERFAAGQDAGRLHSCLTAEGSSSAFTKTEVRTDSRLSLDASKLWFDKPGIWDVYVLYRCWYNKFGTDQNAVLFSDIAPG